ncbi:MAG: DeoR/GlpR transcriptional regulator, partial [Deltaproteobacteria bacterium]|nr:DeoR/GlpR transcriptional regulator [Deltaproteobacteria bacterium]
GYKREKDLVGRAAAEWVCDGEVIFLDGGTTTQSMVPYLLDRKNLTVVTCGLNIACALSHSPHVSTIVVGGELHVQT